MMDNLTPLTRARVRARVRRAAAHDEQQQHEGGELNLVPFLDILVNTIIFLLATTVGILPLAHVHARAPHYGDSTAASGGRGPGELNLTVAVTYRGFIVAGAGGVLRDRAGRLPTIPCQRTRAHDGRCAPTDYPFAALTRTIRAIKLEHPGERRVFITADQGIPYRTVVRTMDALRGRSTPRCLLDKGCLFDHVVLATGLQ